MSLLKLLCHLRLLCHPPLLLPCLFQCLQFLCCLLLFPVLSVFLSVHPCLFVNLVKPVTLPCGISVSLPIPVSVSMPVVYFVPAPVPVVLRILTSVPCFCSCPCSHNCALYRLSSSPLLSSPLLSSPNSAPASCSGCIASPTPFPQPFSIRQSAWTPVPLWVMGLDPMYAPGFATKPECSPAPGPVPSLFALRVPPSVSCPISSSLAPPIGPVSASSSLHPASPPKVTEAQTTEGCHKSRIYGGHWWWSRVGLHRVLPTFADYQDRYDYDYQDPGSDSAGSYLPPWITEKTTRITARMRIMTTSGSCWTRNLTTPSREVEEALHEDLTLGTETGSADSESDEPLAPKAPPKAHHSRAWNLLL
ncbi:hypothetical protein P4O66_002859 [Electrophorus voltai]|uniref:Uncharacterized protein n=1 Tax=Electrophorus voltai TaxID=2609070 RepID=A0AAD8YWY7_9TELE|nr:hypothetical protein P4O66_002859 [Electrophorus voltai]